MLNTFKPLCRLFLALAATSLFAISCDELGIITPVTPPDPAPEFELQLSVSGVTENSAAISVEASIDDVSYFAELYAKTTVGDDLEEFVSTLSIDAEKLLSGDMTLSYDSLETSTEYLFVAFGYSVESSERTTEVWTLSVVTDDLDQPELSSQHDISVSDITWRDAQITITPREADAEYVYGIYSREEFDAKFGGKAESIISARRAQWQALAEAEGSEATWQHYMQQEQCSGELTLMASDRCEPTWGSGYVAYAFGIDDEGVITSTVTVAEFSTLAPASSNNSFEISLDGTTESYVIFSVVPSNNDPYFVALLESEFVDGYAEPYAEMIADLVGSCDDQELDEKHIFEGERQFSSEEFISAVDPAKEYRVVVFGFENGPTTDVVVSDIIRPEAFALNIELDSSNNTESAIGFNVYASDSYHTYHIGIYPAVSVGDDVDLFVDTLLSGEGFAATLRRGSQSVLFDDLQPDTDYYVLLFAYDAATATRGDVVVVPISTELEFVELGLHVGEVTQTTATFDITASDSSHPYYCALYPDIKSSEVGSLVDSIVASEGFIDSLLYGSRSVTFDDLMPGTAYTFILFAYNVAWGEVDTIHVKDITTAELPLVMTGYFDDVTCRSFSFTVNISDEEHAYYCGVHADAEFSDRDSLVQSILSSEEFVDGLKYGSRIYLFDNLEPNTHYTVLLFSYDVRNATADLDNALWYSVLTKDDSIHGIEGPSYDEEDVIW